MTIVCIYFKSTIGISQVASSKEPSVQLEISREFQSDSVNSESLGNSQRIDEIFRNPVIANGIDNGTEALNRSLASIMDSVFYSLMDNDRRFRIDKSSWFQLGLRRNLISAANGRYIVVDRFYAGPGYKQKLFETENLGWALGAELTGEILQIYVLTDGKRVFDQQKSSTIRSETNNWFGILPLLSSVLPPSFNQNEMYDPITQIQTPITFPLNASIFAQMPVGSIRSYNLTGGIRLSAELAELLPREKIDHLRKVADLVPMFPLSIFRRGEHRISVFRRQNDKAWVGVNNVDRSGILFDGSVGAVYAVFKGAIGFTLGNFSWIWGGIPISFTPLNFSYQKSLAKLFDQVFEYDMNHPQAIRCYQSAVRGDFVDSYAAALDSQKGVKSGVIFQYARDQDRKEKSNKKGANLALFRDTRENSSSKSEIEIKDVLGKYYILEALSEVNDKNWNILVGEQERLFQAVVEMAVKPVNKGDRRRAYKYENPQDPFKISINFHIEDRYTNTRELNHYLDTIRRVSGLKLADIQPFPLRDPKQIELREKELNYSSPEKTVKTLHVSPTALGRFSAQVNLSIPSFGIDAMLKKSSTEILQKVAAIFNRKDITIPENDLKSLFHAIIVEPFDMLNLRVSGLSQVDFSDRVLKSLNSIRMSAEPEGQLGGFLNLINTEYPEEFMTLMISLIPDTLSSRSVRLTTKSLSGVNVRDKNAFKNLNGYQRTAGLEFPTQSRYSKIKEKISQFYLDQPESEMTILDISRINIYTKQSPILSEGSWRPQKFKKEELLGVFASIEVDRLDENQEFKVYARLEEAGRLQLGKFDLGEVVFDSMQLDRLINDSEKNAFGIEVVGSRSPFFKVLLLDFAQRPTQFRLTLSVSLDGEIWSPERSVEFAFEDGVLKSLKH